jgi:hypothetical protein
MKRFAGFALFAVWLLVVCLPGVAGANNVPSSESRESQKANRKQAKAMKKYSKAQKKAQNKMFKNSQKKTHYPPQAF